MTVGAWLSKEIGRAPNAYAALLVLAVSFLAYGNSLDVPFQFDDEHAIVANPYLRDLSYVPQYFSRPDMFSALPGHDMYRPLLLTTFALNYDWGGYDPFFWRLTSIALHALGAVGVFLTCLVLSRQLCQRTPRAGTTGALVAALFFALHPVFSETVDYASARSSTLATAGVVWAFLLHRLAAERRGGVARVALWTGSLLLFLGALLSKEIAIVFPALLLACAFLERRGWAAVLPAVFVALCYLYVRSLLLGAAVVNFQGRAVTMAAADPGSGGARLISDNLFTQARVIGAYVTLFLWPRGLCVDRDVRVSTTMFEGGVVAGGLLIAGILFLAWRLRRRRPVASLGLVWFLVALAPTSSIVPLNQVMNEHRLYLPGVGVALAVGALLGPLLLRARGWWPRPAVAAVAALLLALTLVRNEDWRDSERLWRSATEVSPTSAGAWNSLGVALRQRGRDDEALSAFRRARELDGYAWNAPFNIGTLYLDRGRRDGRYEDLEAAQRWLERSLEVKPGAERSRWFLAETMYAMGRVEQAEKAFRELAGLNPRLFEMTRYSLARIAMDRGHYGVAEQLYGEALRGKRDPVSAHLGLAALALELGQRDVAARRAKQAMEARPHSPRPYVFLARLYRGTAFAAGQLFEAERRGYSPTAEERRDLLERRP